MIILGLSLLSPADGLHDTTTALLIDGKLKSAVSEERFSGIKHSRGYPSYGIKFCLQNEGLRLSDVDKVVVGMGLFSKYQLTETKQHYSYAKNDPNFLRMSKINEKKPSFYDHEYIHAKTGYFLSGFKKALVISLDGGGVDHGKFVSGGIFVIDEGTTELIRLYPIEASLGLTYGGLTEACGFRYGDGEGKTMSLAAFAENENDDTKNKAKQMITQIFPKWDGIDFVEDGIKFPTWRSEHGEFHAIFDDQRLPSIIASLSKEVIAWAAQKILEETIIRITQKAIESTGIKNVVFTGGIFYNMIANMILRETLEKQNCSFFFNPICGDIGTAVGAALEEYYQQTGNYNGFEWPNLSLGPKYNDEEIHSSLNRQNIDYTKVDAVSTCVDLLDKGKIVGWFQGKSELGPRGLGNRSILSRVDDLKFKDKINNKVKHRENWRPFCPTITVDKSSYFLENYSYAPYMILGFRTLHSDEIPAVVHVDNTSRPQTIQKSYNPDYYEVVKNLGGIVLNTSLNLSGDPIVTTPDDAIITFKKVSNGCYDIR